MAAGRLTRARAGTAAGDLLDVGPDHSFDVVERGRNVAVHVSAPAAARAPLARLKDRLEQLGGWCDGIGWTRDRSSSLSVFTVPVGAGFPAIEQAMADYRAAVPAGEWYYVNVYAADDTTPLNWWVD